MPTMIDDGVPIFPELTHPFHEPIYRETLSEGVHVSMYHALANLLRRRQEFIGQTKGELTFLGTSKTSPTPLVGADDGSLAFLVRKWADSMTSVNLLQIQKEIAQLQLNPTWSDADGTSYSGPTLTQVESRVLENWRAIIENCRTVLASLRYRVGGGATLFSDFSRTDDRWSSFAVGHNYFWNTYTQGPLPIPIPASADYSVYPSVYTGDLQGPVGTSCGLLECSFMIGRRKSYHKSALGQGFYTTDKQARVESSATINGVMYFSPLIKRSIGTYVLSAPFDPTWVFHVGFTTTRSSRVAEDYSLYDSVAIAELSMAYRLKIVNHNTGELLHQGTIGPGTDVPLASFAFPASQQLTLSIVLEIIYPSTPELVSLIESFPEHDTCPDDPPGVDLGHWNAYALSVFSAYCSVRIVPTLQPS